jgi:hypothetical protein
MPKRRGEVCRFSPVAALCAAALLVVSTSCAHQSRLNPTDVQNQFNGPSVRGLTQPFYDPDVRAFCDPPVGWKPDPLKKNDVHTHQVWHSPSGATAYGVIHFKLPLPVGENLALQGFMAHMKQTEGEATLLQQERDPNLPGIRFVAEGGKYRIRANLIVGDWEAWAIYAGTFRNQKPIESELDKAIRAREHTRVGIVDIDRSN